jgi:alkyl hydroperoxide reductase subunit AhpF
MALKIHCDRCDRSAATTVGTSTVNKPAGWRDVFVTMPNSHGSEPRGVSLCPGCDQSLTRWFREGDPKVSGAARSDEPQVGGAS